MLTVKVFPTIRQQRAPELIQSAINSGYKQREDGMFEKKNDKLMIINISELGEALRGLNPDEISFECIPSTGEIEFATTRVSSKKGKVFVLGEERRVLPKI